MRVVVLDTDGERVWTGCDRQFAEDRLAQIGPAPFVLLVHTSDTRLRAGCSAETYVSRLESFERTYLTSTPAAVLYFSGAEDGAWHLKEACASVRAANGLHRWLESRKIDHELAAEFAGRVWRLARDWEVRLGSDQTAPPGWELLRYDWLEDVAESVFCAGLGLRYQTGASPLDNGAIQKGLAQFIRTAEETRGSTHLLTARELWRAGDVEGENLTEALRFLVEIVQRQPMRRVEAGRLFREERTRVSHDLFKNQFGACLQPGWDASGVDRLSDRDIVVSALRGELTAIEAVRSAQSIWAQKVWPALMALLASVETELGFVTTRRFEEARNTVEACDRTIRSVLDAVRHVADVQRERAAGFWQACGAVGELLNCLATRSDEYLERWDPEAARPRANS